MLRIPLDQADFVIRLRMCVQNELERRKEDAFERVRVLSEALPNIQQFRGTPCRRQLFIRVLT
jgi:hypothetical protein